MSTDKQFIATISAPYPPDPTTAFQNVGVAGDYHIGAAFYGARVGVVGSSDNFGVEQPNSAAGVQGFGTCPQVAGVFGTVSPDGAGNLTNPGPGVWGQGGGVLSPPRSGNNAIGVYGTGGAGDSDGVQGVGSGSFSGVAGFADPNSTTGAGTGVFGQGASGGPGVRGIGDGGNNLGPSNPAGVYGQGGAGDANGVEGHGTGNFSGVAGYGADGVTSLAGTGVWGKGGQGGISIGGEELPGAPGVRGIGGGGNNTAPYNAAGVYGQGGAGDANGVEGHGTGNFSGVAGFADSQSTTGPGTGVYGQGAVGGAGVWGIGDGGPNTPPGGPVGVYGQGGPGTAGVLGTGDLWGVVGRSTATKGVGVAGQASGPDGVGVAGNAGSPAAFAGVFTGSVVVSGDFTVAGNKSAAVPFPDGSHRRLYCVESPESWFEDFGTGVLAGGQAEVRLDPDFAATVHTGDYHVFLTEYDDNNCLYVTQRSVIGFTVRAKTSNYASGTFSYRVVAKRSGIKAPRLEKVTMPTIDVHPTHRRPPDTFAVVEGAPARPVEESAVNQR